LSDIVSLGLTSSVGSVLESELCLCSDARLGLGPHLEGSPTIHPSAIHALQRV